MNGEEDSKINDILKIEKELNNKTSSKLLNTLFSNQINTDSNLMINNNINNSNNKSRSTVNLQNLFSDKDSFTLKEIRITTREYFHLQKRPSIKNFDESLINININENKNQKKNYIENMDFYFEDDMFIPESSSFPNEHEEDFLNKLKFIEDNDYNDDVIDIGIRTNSISYKTNQKDNIYLDYYNSNNNILKKNYDRMTSKNLKINDLFFDEKELNGKNILYLDMPNTFDNNEKKGNNDISNDNNENMFTNNLDINDKEIDNIININSDLNDNNENNISYISIDLLIKKIALHNFRNNYSYLYKCFFQQFKYFIPIYNFISKIISAFQYYNKSIKKNCSELVYFLNQIILKNYDLIKNNKNNLEQIQIFYLKIKNITFDDPDVNQDLIIINNLLFKNIINNINKESIDEKKNKDNNENDNNNNYNLSKMFRTKSKSIFLKFLKKKETKGEIKEKGKKHNYKYFYIFDYTKEEIAAYLTCESYQLLSNIPENELYNKNFNSKQKDKIAPNIMKIINRYDKLIIFIIEDICSYDHKTERVDIIEKWLRIAYTCFEFKNFNDLVMINSLFCNYLFKKLKKTWKKLSKKTLMSIKTLNHFCNGNQCYLNIRNEIFKSKGKPYVPFLGILLKEIMTIEEMKYIINNNNINFKKIVKLDKTINRFFEFKNKKYPFEKPKHLEILSNICPKNEDEIELIIKEIEPKLKLHAKNGDKKRLTQSDELFYK